MIVYNVTVKINNDTRDEWLEWMKSEHVPAVMNSKMFESYRIARILGQDEADGVTYSIQYVAENLDNYHRYVHQHGPALQKEHTDKYEGKFVAFRTVMEVV